jgi:dUTP pyrophosphatase
MTLKVKRLVPNAKLPIYATLHDAGMDLYSSKTIILSPGQRVTVPTGVAVAIPKGYVGLIWDKSGIAFNGGLKTLGGVIDSGYRGEIGVIIQNLSLKEYTIQEGKKIAQMLVQKIEQKEIIEVDSLDETDRGSGGFGSTGLD